MRVHILHAFMLKLALLYSSSSSAPLNHHHLLGSLIWAVSRFLLSNKFSFLLFTVHPFVFHYFVTFSGAQNQCRLDIVDRQYPFSRKLDNFSFLHGRLLSSLLPVAVLQIRKALSSLAQTWDRLQNTASQCFSFCVSLSCTDYSWNCPRLRSSRRYWWLHVLMQNCFAPTSPVYRNAIIL